LLARVRIVEEIATKSVSGLGSCSRLAPTFPAPKPVRTKANLWSGMRTSRAVSSAASQSACDKAAAHLSSSCFFTVRFTVDTIAGEAWTSVEGPTCGVDGLLRGQRFMIGESPHEGVIDGRDQSRRTSRLHVHAAVSECRVLSRLLRDRSRLATWRPSSRPSRASCSRGTPRTSAAKRNWPGR